MTIEREFNPGSRYYYDFEICTTGNGWAQVDTSQDASYFGTWANPFIREIFTYCEGDTTRQIADDDQEFCNALQEIKTWNETNGYRFLGIDPGFNEELKAKIKALGLLDI